MTPKDGSKDRSATCGTEAACGRCKVATDAAWGDATGRAVQHLARSKSLLHRKRKQTVYRQGEANQGFYCLLSGMVVLSIMDARGDVVTTHIVPPGETFGYRSFLADEGHVTTATAVADSVVCHIGRRAATEVLEDNPDLQRMFSRWVASDARHGVESHLRANTMTVRERLIHFLLSIGVNYAAEGEADGDADGDGGGGGRMILDLPLMRVDLAALIGTVPETLSRTVRRLEADGLARFDRRRVVIPDAASLRREIADW